MSTVNTRLRLAIAFQNRMQRSTMLSWSTLSVLVLVALLQSTSAVPATVGMTFTYILCSCSLIFTTGECPVGVPTYSSVLRTPMHYCRVSWCERCNMCSRLLWRMQCSSIERMSQIGVQVWRAFMTCSVYSVYGETLSSIDLHSNQCVLEDFPIVVLYLPASLRGVHLFHLPPVALCDCIPKWFIGDVEVYTQGYQTKYGPVLHPL